MLPSHHQLLSLTARLILGYTVGCIVTIAATGWFYRQALTKQVEQENGQFLVHHVTMLRNSIVEKADSPVIALKTLMTFSARDPQKKISSRLIDQQGNVIFSTCDFREYDAKSFPAALSDGQDFALCHNTVSEKKESEYYMSARMVGIAEADLIYQAVWITNHLTQWKEQFDSWWMLAMMIGCVCAAAFGWFHARRSLAPLHYITTLLQKTSMQDLGTPLDAAKLPPEVAELAGEFNRMLEGLHQQFRQLSQFTADAAHEFRTPLNNLIGSTSLALSKQRHPQEYAAVLQSHLEQFQRLAGMIESLLFLARADNHSAGFQLKAVDVSACAHEVLDFYSAVAEERNIQLLLHGEATIMADESMLRIALTNLVSNGLRFTPSEKSLRIHIERNSQQEVAVSVIDSGPGIAQEHYELIFDRYYRLEKSRSTEGAGLGLSIVQAIMKLHGGRAFVDRAADGGAIFTLVFPAQGNRAMDA